MPTRAPTALPSLDPTTLPTLDPTAQPSFELDCCTPTCCCAGFGCVRQTISADGQGGTAFINATGTVERKTLEPGETLVIDSNSLVAWHGAALGVRPAGSCMACCCNGEGCCNTTVTGPGTAWVQSMPWAQYKAKMGVTIKLDKAGNVVAAGAPPSAEHADTPGGHGSKNSDDLRAASRFLYGEWLPRSGREPRDAPFFAQRVSVFPDVPEHEAVTDLFLPLSPGT